MAIQRRDLVVVGVLSAVTLGLYNIYLIYKWTDEINGLLGREKYIPWLPLLLGILTCGTSGCIFEALYALDVEKEINDRGMQSQVPEAGDAKLIIGMNIGVAVMYFTGILAILGFPLGIAASVLMQRMLNRIADVQQSGLLVRASSSAPYSTPVV